MLTQLILETGWTVEYIEQCPIEIIGNIFALKEAEQLIMKVK